MLLAPLLLAATLPAFALNEASRADLRFGDCRTAVADLAGPANLATVEGQADALALARCALSAGQLDRAEELAALAPGSSLGAYGMLIQGEVRLQRGDTTGAAKLLDGLRLPGPAGRRAQMLLGQAQVEMGAYAAGRDTLNGLLATAELGNRAKLAEPGGADPAEIRWWLAQGAIRRGEPAAAVSVLEKIWTWNPTSPRAAEAEALLKEQGIDVRDTTLGDARDRIRDRARTLEKLRLYPEALALIEPLPRRNEDPATIRRMAKLTFRAKDYPASVAWYAKIPNPTPDERFDHALGTSRTGDYDTAAKLYTALYTDLPGTSQADTASYKVGYLAYDKGDLDRAVPLLREHLKRYPSSAHADEARWFIAWSLYRSGDLAAADIAMSEVLSLHGRSGLAAGAAYWKARIDDQQGNSAKAREGYTSVRKNWPLSGYAWFASWRLGETFDTRTVQAAPPPPAALASDDRFNRGMALAAVGLDDWARTELSPVVATAKQSTDGRIAMAHALILAGDYTGAQALVRGKCPSPHRTPTASAESAACHPRPLGTAALQTAESHGLPPHLPFGIMTAESALKPWVTSPVGARGLMQLMPEVAAKVQPSVFGDQPFHPDDLYRPGVNAALGIAELGSLHAQFAGRLNGPELPAVIAGYNGGAEAVERWLSGFDTPPEPDRFAEDIGYTETRRYVRRVLGYLQTYRYIYGEGT
jgi:soluble lytic murein transglycosylase-like protein